MGTCGGRIHEVFAEGGANCEAAQPRRSWLQGRIQALQPWPLIGGKLLIY